MRSFGVHALVYVPQDVGSVVALELDSIGAQSF